MFFSAAVEDPTDHISGSLNALESELRSMPFTTIPRVLERVEPRWCAPGFYRATGSICGRQWVPSGWGEELHMTPCFGGVFPSDTTEEMGLCDFVAWRPGAPARWCFRTGEATLLGRQHLVWAQQDRTPLNVYATPRDWVMAGGDGICVLRVDGVHELLGIRELRCHDTNVGLRLDNALREVVPIVMVPKPAA